MDSAAAEIRRIDARSACTGARPANPSATLELSCLANRYFTAGLAPIACARAAWPLARLSSFPCSAAPRRRAARRTNAHGPRPDRSGSVPARPAASDTALGLQASVLDRRAYVRAVLERNPSIESARQGWRAALSRVSQSGTFEDPMIDLGIAPLSIGSSKAPLGYELGISQKLPWFGKRGFEASAAAAEADASKSDYEALKRELALSAVVPVRPILRRRALNRDQRAPRRVDARAARRSHGSISGRAGLRSGLAAGRGRARPHGARHRDPRLAA